MYIRIEVPSLKLLEHRYLVWGGSLHKAPVALQTCLYHQLLQKYVDNLKSRMYFEVNDKKNYWED